MTGRDSQEARKCSPAPSGRGPSAPWPRERVSSALFPACAGPAPGQPASSTTAGGETGDSAWDQHSQPTSWQINVETAEALLTVFSACFRPGWWHLGS